MKIELERSDVERIADALEILAENYNRASMQRAREKCLELRAKIVNAELNQRHASC